MIDLKVLSVHPIHGALKRLDSYLETELTTLAKYFGKSIFNSMVVAASMPLEAFEDGNWINFSDRALAQTKQNLVALLQTRFSRRKGFA